MLYKTNMPFLFFTLLCATLNAQVGIGTLEPEADLHIAGDLLVQENFHIKPLPAATSLDEDFKLVSRLTNSTPVGEIKVLDVDSLTVAPINVVNYEFTNVSGDNLTDVNLQFSANNFVVGVANFRQVGGAIEKQAVDGDRSIGTFVIRTFISNNRWHLEIKNRDLDLINGSSLTYYVTLIVYDKSYYRNMPPIVTNLNGNNTGTASSVPDLY